MGARLIRIKQDGSYLDYLKKFLNYSAPLPEMAESVLIDSFVTGLETNLKVEVLSRHPVTLEDCMQEAQMVSDRDLAIKLALNECGSNGPRASEAQTQMEKKKMTINAEKKEGKGSEYVMKQVSIPIKGNYSREETSVKRLSDSEFRARLDKGLCFRCNEKYSPGQWCKGKTNCELMFFIANEEELEEVNGKEEGELETVELETLEIEGKTEIALRTILGFTSKGTMKL